MVIDSLSLLKTIPRLGTGEPLTNKDNYYKTSAAKTAATTTFLIRDNIVQKFKVTLEGKLKRMLWKQIYNTITSTALLPC